MRTARFLGEFLSKPMVTGAVAPSSSYLARTVVEGLDLENARAILEYGPGTGAFTTQVLQHANPASKFVAIEINPHMAEEFRAKHPGVILAEDSVANVREICDRAGIESVDCIVSGLPWASFSESMQKEFLDAMMRTLKPGGRFVTFAYIHGLLLPQGKRFANLLPRYFSKITKSRIVWLNLPPALVYRCTR
jgi:phosphatidylethanolamine/phosphatidyl-N-methylethanolamine N-methyltransferase